MHKTLRAIYLCLPETTCRRRGACCSLLPAVHLPEMHLWLSRWQQNPDKAHPARRLVEHFLSNAAAMRPCPFAEPDRCTVYEDRFFGCRAYGLWSPESYAAKAEAARRGAEAVVQAWRGLGVELSTEVLCPQPDYCRDVNVVEGQRPSDDRLDAWEEEIAALGEAIPDAAELAPYGGDLAYMMAARCLGPQEALQQKVAYTRAFLAKDTAAAQAIMDAAMARVEAYCRAA